MKPSPGLRDVDTLIWMGVNVSKSSRLALKISALGFYFKQEPSACERVSPCKGRFEAVEVAGCV